MTTEQITALITEYWAWMWAGITWLIVFSLIIGVYDFMDKGRDQHGSPGPRWWQWRRKRRVVERLAEFDVYLKDI